jgi:hypothetical protein
MQDCTGNGATLNLAAQNLNHMGYILHHCGIINTLSMATISNELSKDAAQKKIELQAMYHVIAPSALNKLTAKDGNPTKITKKEILSILFSVFIILEEEKNKKEILVAILMKQIDKDPTKIPFEVVRPVATVSEIPALAAAGLAAAQ